MSRFWYWSCPKLVLVLSVLGTGTGFGTGTVLGTGAVPLLVLVAFTGVVPKLVLVLRV